ncbi:MAG: enoyl-CoA hydratase-related protein [Pseudomonadota bacterium]
MSDANIWIEDKGNYLVVVSDNPAQKNVLTLEYHALQLEALKRAGEDERIAAVIFVGRSGYFSAGGELGLLREALDGGPAEREAPVALFHKTIDAIRSCPKPVIAAVHGGAAGGGLSTMLACDLIVADEGATFLAAHVKIGATIDGGLTWFLGQQLPRALAMDLCLFGSVVTGEDLHQHGLITTIVPEGTAEATAVKLAEKLARGPVGTQAKLKALLNASSRNSLSEQLALEKETLVDALGGPAAREGVSAFLEKRRPDFASAEGRST